MNAILLSMYFVSACLVLLVIGISVKRSAFGILLGATLVWFWIGSCVYPIFDLLGVVERGIEVSDFIAKNGEPGLAAAFHILLAAIGMVCGYLYRPRHGVVDRMVGWANKRLVGAKGISVWRHSIFLGICAYLLYFYLVGFDVALINAAAARGGDFDGFGEKESFMFIKTLAAIGFVATCFLPAALLQKDRVLIAAYALLLAMAYSNSISRNLVLYSGIVPVLIYVRLKWKVQKRSSKLLSYLIILALIPFALLVLNYGKVMGHYISSYLSGGSYSMVEEVGDVNILNAIFSNFGFQWVSVQGGIEHFFRTGAPLITQEQVLATFFGFIPSRVLSYLGADFLYYGNVVNTIACANSHMFGYSECTVPPLAIGYSAYLLPGGGGLLMGLVMLRIYGAIERLWIAAERDGYQKIWIPYFLFSLTADFFTFIPPALTMAMTQFLWVLLISRLRFKSSGVRRSAVA